MSYILDAIRKAEQERQKQQSPELLQIQSAPATVPRKERRWLPWAILFLLVLLITVALNIWFLQGKSQTEPNVERAVTSAVTVQKEPATVPVTKAPQTTDQVNPTVSSSAPQVITTPAASRRLPLWQAPAQAKAAIAALQFSFHVYSDNPARRTIIINRKRMREGQQISSDLLLQNIDEQGVVIAYQDILVEVPVLEQW
jgi:hypothetical protein